MVVPRMAAERGDDTHASRSASAALKSGWPASRWSWASSAEESVRVCLGGEREGEKQRRQQNRELNSCDSRIRYKDEPQRNETRARAGPHVRGPSSPPLP